MMLVIFILAVISAITLTTTLVIRGRRTPKMLFTPQEERALEIECGIALDEPRPDRPGVVHLGPTRPADMAPGDRWIDTSNGGRILSGTIRTGSTTIYSATLRKAPDAPPTPEEIAQVTKLNLSNSSARWMHECKQCNTHTTHPSLEKAVYALRTHGCYVPSRQHQMKPF